MTLGNRGNTHGSVHTSANLIFHFSNKNGKRKYYLSLSYLHISKYSTPFAVHYEKIRIHLREKATNSAKIHSLARKSEHLRINQIQ